MKTCRVCRVEFPNTSEFFQQNGKYLRTECKVCKARQYKEWGLRNPEKKETKNANWRTANRERYQQTNREWHAKNPKRSTAISRGGYLRRKYGIDQRQLEVMVSTQKGECANPGCVTPVTAGGIQSHIDHDHTTGKIRGVLCQMCNQALGLLKEDAGRIHGLAQYLEQFT